MYRLPRFDAALPVRAPRPSAPVRAVRPLAICFAVGLLALLGAGSAWAQTLVPLTGVQRITAGDAHTCAVTGDGRLLCWGFNARGQLGDGSTTDRRFAVPVAGDLQNVSALDAGRFHTCAEAGNGGLHCWGANGSGQLGDGSTENRLTPEPSNTPDLTAAGREVLGIAAGGQHTCVLSRRSPGEATSIACSGSNNEGQIGNGLVQSESITRRVEGVGLRGASAIAVGSNHSCLLQPDGEVRCWGLNSSGQLGEGSTARAATSVRVVGLPAGGATTIAAGETHTCALSRAGQVYCWGANSFEQLGVPRSVRTQSNQALSVPGLPASEVTSIAAGPDGTCALTDTQGVWCWGRTGLTTTFEPSRVTHLDAFEVTGIALGVDHRCALVRGGAVYCWGNNVVGQVGNGSSEIVFRDPVPVMVEGQPQAIAFGAAPSGLRVGGTATLSASGGGSGNPVVFSSQTPAVCTVSGSTVTGVGAGTCTVAANQAAGGIFGAAPEVTQSFDVALNAQTITFANPGAQVFGTTRTLTATASSGLAVSFSSVTSSVCAISSGGALSFVSAGTCTITAEQAGNSSFAAAAPVTRSFNVTAVVPGAPGIGTATAGDAQATVTFTAPSFAGGAMISGYTVTSNPGGVTATGSGSPITVTGLANGTAYTFTVTASNSAGTSAASAPSNPVTPQPAFALPALRADRALIAGSEAIEIDVLANDRIDAVLRSALVLSIARQPTAGTASIVTPPGGTPRVRYAPSAAAARDALVYRVCFGGLTPCVEATLTIEPRPLAVAGLQWSTTSERGFRDQPLTGLPALPGARFIAHGLVAPFETSVLTALPGDASAPWGAGAIATVVRPLAGGSAGRGWRVLVDARSTDAGDIDLYLGVDANGNGRADGSELACTSASKGGSERCDLALDVAANAAAAYWIVVHAASGGQAATIAAFETPLDVPVSQRRLMATGPGTLAANAAFDVRFGWDDGSFLPGQSRGGWLEIRADDSRSIGWLPLRIDRSAGDPSAFALASGVDHAIALLPGQAHERLYIDVPPGTARLEVTTRSAQAVDLFLARVPAIAPSAATPVIAPAPARSSASHSGRTVGGDERIVIDTPAAGRWYVTPANSPLESNAAVTVRATLTGTAPTLQPGGFFNPQRSGSGVFVYPAGDQWFALWFTYRQDGTPTWYTLQAAAPGAHGVWRAPIFRSSWDGARNRLTPVGEATVTPTARDSFAFSYTLDGETGSEAFVTFGGGCPIVDGAPLNISGHWFDPRTAGSGYTVQGFPAYEFNLVFGYDGQGVPRFLVAERPGTGAATSTLPLEQLRGACPLCARSGNPARMTVGTLQRTIEGGTLRRFTVDARYVDGVPGRWVANDAVIPLGQLRGCALN